MTLLEQREEAWTQAWEARVQYSNRVENCKDLKGDKKDPKKNENPTYWPTAQHRVKEAQNAHALYFKWLALQEKCYNAGLPNQDPIEMFRGYVKTEIPAKVGKRIKQIWMKPQ